MQHPPAKSIARWIAGLACASALLFACAADRDIPVHGWWNERGPVVRHEDFPEDCSLCHRGSSWTDLVDDFEFDHLQETGYELVGAHAQAKCLRCHNDRGPVQVFQRQGCAGCHTDIHNNLLGSTCDACHGQQTWQPEGQIAEHRKTRFPLTGVHLVTPCWRCHERAENGDFSQQDMRCETCHQSALARAVDPDHLSNGWAQNCERCHYASEWSGAGFGHQALTVGCVTCHREDYQTALNPRHTPTAFPVNCRYCHTNESWSPAELDHSFPLVLIHAQFTCDTCHMRPGNFQTFSCTHCHWHDLNPSTGRHKGVRGFVWQNKQCIACHPRGH